MPRVKRPSRRRLPGVRKQNKVRPHTRGARGPGEGPPVKVRPYKRRDPKR